MEHGYQKVRSARKNHNLIQAVADNFDFSISSPNGLKQTHSMAVIMTQKDISTDMSNLGPDYIHRKSKQDLQSHQLPEAQICRYKGPAKPPMPKNDSKFQVLLLKSS